MTRRTVVFVNRDGSTAETYLRLTSSEALHLATLEKAERPRCVESPEHRWHCPHCHAVLDKPNQDPCSRCGVAAVLPTEPRCVVCGGPNADGGGCEFCPRVDA